MSAVYWCKIALVSFAIPLVILILVNDESEALSSKSIVTKHISSKRESLLIKIIASFALLFVGSVVTLNILQTIEQKRYFAETEESQSDEESETEESEEQE